MSTENVKEFLQTQTKIEAKNWKRVSKKTFPNGDEFRLFEDQNSGTQFETIEYAEDGYIRVKCISGPLFVDKQDETLQLIKDYFINSTIPNKETFLATLIPQFFTYFLLPMSKDELKKDY